MSEELLLGNLLDRATTGGPTYLSVLYVRVLPPSILSLTIPPQRIGIIIGGVAVFLILLIMTCTCYARRNDKKKYAAVAATTAAQARRGDHIPLVEKVEKPDGATGPSWTAQQALGRRDGSYAASSHPPRSNSYQSSMAPSRSEYGGYSPQAHQQGFQQPYAQPQQHQYQSPQYYTPQQQAPQYYAPQPQYANPYADARVGSPVSMGGGGGYGATQAYQQGYATPPQWPQGGRR